MILKIRATYAVFKSINDHTIEIMHRITTRISSMLSSPPDKPKTNRYAYNFASLYGGAIILDKTSNLKHVENILQDSSDSYMISECSVSNQFLIISLKEEIQLDAISFINKELYSSTIGTFELFGSLVYPTEDWQIMGQFMAQDTNQWQSFHVEPHFIRYLKIHIIEFYQWEYYCTLTQVKVFGQTVIGDFVEYHKRQNINTPKIEQKQQQQQHEDSIKNMHIPLLDNIIEPQKFTTTIKCKEDVDEIYIEEQDDTDQTCTFMDYFYKRHKNKRPDEYIDIVPYATNQSVFKITAQNIMIISHNQDVLKKALITIQQHETKKQSNEQQIEKLAQQMQQQLNQQKIINHKLSESIENQRIQFYIIILVLIAINCVVMLYKCNQQSQWKKKHMKNNGNKSALNIRHNDMFINDSDQEIEFNLKDKEKFKKKNHNNNNKQKLN